MKQLFYLKGDYAGLRARRLKQAGRIVLWRMLDDYPRELRPKDENPIEPYWLVQIRAFNEGKDRPRLRALTGSKFGNGAKRFCREQEAWDHFNLLLSHPGYLAEAKSAKIADEKKNERLRQWRESGSFRPFKKSSLKNEGDVPGTGV